MSGLFLFLQVFPRLTVESSNSLILCRNFLYDHN